MAWLSPSQRQQAGSWLVFLQFSLLLGLAALAWPSLRPGAYSWACVALAAASVVWGSWTLLHNRLGNFNIRPTPKVGGSLVTSGPYMLVRHPMYTAVLSAAGAMACVAESLTAALAWTVLLGVLWIKADLEEQWLRETYPAYANYCSQTKRFVPWLF
jgi:protein-S-isoprenylcysteine O-methyltransferase Ste14